MIQIISYDISDDKLRNKFSRILSRNGAVRLQYSVYEINSSNRVYDNLIVKIDSFSKQISGGDSILIFNVNKSEIKKYGNAIHRDRDIFYF